MAKTTDVVIKIDPDEIANIINRMVPAFKRAIEALHEIQAATSLTDAHMKAFMTLLELGEIQDDDRP